MGVSRNNDNDNLYIVVADDEIEDHKMIKSAIRKCNISYIVTSVYNGMQLMDLLLKRAFYRTDSYRAPDVIILDLQMQLLDGFEVMKQIRELEHLRDIPVFVLTVSRQQADHQKALEYGAHEVYTKPSSARDLQPLINSICEYARSNRQSIRGLGMRQ